MKIDLVMDFQFGSTGKGLLAGYLAKRNDYTTVACSFATNAGHTYIDKSRGIHMMTQQLPTGISGPTVRRVLIGPGALIHIPTLFAEMDRYADMLIGKQIFIHPQAAIVEDDHADEERRLGLTKIGSTTKGVGAAMIQRIKRDPQNLNTAGCLKNKSLLAGRRIIVSDTLYRAALETSDYLLVEGAQGFSLSMYHGFYPYTTSRDVTPWQIAADCGLPFRATRNMSIFGTLRTFPIRVNNRDGTSGPGYPDQREIDWDLIGVAPELTTVTKLPRRVFEFSMQQLEEALWHCGGYKNTHLFLNFANYMQGDKAVAALIDRIDNNNLGIGGCAFVGYGPDDSDVMTRAEFEVHLAEH